MTTQYDAGYCEDFFRRAQELGDIGFVRLWVHASGLVPIPDSADPPWQLDSLVIEWYNMRPWNRQGVLFLMAKHIDVIAERVAIKAADKARLEDPI